jgi:DHA1 family bicyclomycin/chloramphenicol resistance-like MFS transporter
MRFNVHRLGFTLFLAALTALPPLSIDMALPSLALVEADLHAPQAQAAAAIAIFLAGFSTAPLVVGPLADRFGRKPVMLAGLALFTLCAAGSALAPSIAALLAFRLVQGAAAGAVGILPRAIIRDLFEGREARLHIAAVSLVFSAAPLIAPALGAGILFIGSWRWIYVVLTCVGAGLTVASLALFEESHAPENRRNLKPSTVLAGYRRALTNPSCAGFSLLAGLVFAGLFAYVNVSPLLYMQGYGVSKAGFAGLFAITASGVIVGSSINAWLLSRHARPKAVLDAALAFECLAGLALLAVGLAGAGSALIVAGVVMGLHLVVRPHLSQRRARGGPAPAGDRRPRLRGAHHDTNAVRRARRRDRRRPLPQRFAACARRHHERRRPCRRRSLRILSEGEDRGRRAAPLSLAGDRPGVRVTLLAASPPRTGSSLARPPGSRRLRPRPHPAAAAGRDRRARRPSARRYRG